MKSFWLMAASVVPVLLVGNAACQQDAISPPGTEPVGSLDSGAEDGGERETDAGPATGRGFVVLDTEPGSSTSVLAAFGKTDFPGQPSDAHRCVVSDGREPVPDGGAYPAAESAGRIEVTAGSRSATLKVVTEGGKVIGYSRADLSGGTSPLSPDVPIRVEAKGATVPAFELEVLPTAALEVTTSPAGGIVVGQPFEVRWSSSNAEYVAVWLQTSEVSIRCHAEAPTGSLVVPSEHVAKVAADAKDGVKLTIRTSRTKTGRFGDFDVTLDHNSTSTPVSLPVR